MIKTVSCRTCGRTVTVQEPANGHPYGWYTLSVNVPPDMGHKGEKFFRWLGMFCSIGCLMAHEETLIRDAELAQELYDPD
jgi:hypothetical protein